MSTLTVIGIDPGSRNTGWGVVSEASGVLRFEGCGVIKPPTSGEFSERLAFIFRELRKVINAYKPMEAAVEQVFFGKNATSALKLGQARGVACAACASFEISVKDYEPTVVKKNLVGVGRAEKEQVAFMVGRLLNQKADWQLDASDALAVAICHLTERRLARRLAGINNNSKE